MFGPATPGVLIEPYGLPIVDGATDEIVVALVGAEHDVEVAVIDVVEDVIDVIVLDANESVTGFEDADDMDVQSDC